jgi:hypothetical protein
LASYDKITGIICIFSIFRGIAAVAGLLTAPPTTGHGQETGPSPKVGMFKRVKPFKLKGFGRGIGVFYVKFLWAAGSLVEPSARPNFLLYGVGPAA